MYFAGIGGPTNKINYTHYSLLTTIVLLLFPFLTLSFLLGQIRRQKYFSSSPFSQHSRTFSLIAQRTSHKQRQKKMRLVPHCYPFDLQVEIVRRSLCKLYFFLSCLSFLAISTRVIKRRPRLLAFHLFIHFESFNSTPLKFQILFRKFVQCYINARLTYLVPAQFYLHSNVEKYQIFDYKVNPVYSYLF